MRTSALSSDEGKDGQSDGCSISNQSWSRHKGCAGVRKVFHEARKSRGID